MLKKFSVLELVFPFQASLFWVSLKSSVSYLDMEEKQYLSYKKTYFVTLGESLTFFILLTNLFNIYFENLKLFKNVDVIFEEATPLPAQKSPLPLLPVPWGSLGGGGGFYFLRFTPPLPYL